MSRADVVLLKCPNCGANLPTPPGEESQNVTCTYCDHGFRYEVPEAAAPPEPPEPTAAGRASPSRGAPALIVVMLLVAVGGIITAISVSRSARSSSSVRAAASVPSATWDNVGGPPIAVTIAGQDAVCGRTRAVGAGDELAIACFDATTLAPRWTLDGLGTYSGGDNAYRAVHVAAAAGVAVVSDNRDQLHLIDLETGKPRAQLGATDHVERLCPIGPHTIWARVADGRHLTIDVATMVAGEAHKVVDSCDVFERAHVDGPGPSAPGFEALHVWIAGDVGVAGGIKTPGTAYPMVIGFDPHTRDVRWTVRLGANATAAVQERSNAHDALAGDAYVTGYGVGSKGWHVAAFDAHTGAPLWDTALRNIFAVDELDGVVAGEHTIYVVRTSSLDVLDAKTGKPRGTIGHETYEDEH